jgi:hypothetical protein
LALAVLMPAGAGAFAPPSPWDGTNPFKCTIQDAGTGTKVPDPGADPYCVHFDKTQQNITQLGLVTFLLDEPERVIAAAPKCFYFQEDHWRGSLIQSDGRTVLYEFVGHYFINQATGDGGAWVTGFSIAGQTFDPTSLPGFPPGYGQYFGPGTGGVMTHNAVPVNPQCAAKLAHDPGAIYAASPATPPRCAPGTGQVDARGLGPLALGAGEQVVRAELGNPASVDRGFLRYCVQGGGALLVGQPGDRSGTLGAGGDAPSVVLETTGRGFTLLGRRGSVAHVGDSTRSLRRAFRAARTFGRVHGMYAWRLAPQIVALTSRGHVRALAVYQPRSIRSGRALLGYLRRA